MPTYGYDPNDLKQLRETGIDPHTKADSWYDYTNQAWVVNGVYKRCGHPEKMNCGCYGRAHEGETPAQTIIEQYNNVRAQYLRDLREASVDFDRAAAHRLRYRL